MKDIERMLNHEHELYPQMELQDYYKVLYGSTMGPSHLLMNKEKAEDEFMLEWKNVKSSSVKKLYDDISVRQQIVRLHLSACKYKGLSPSCVFNAVVETAKSIKENKLYFYEKLNEAFCVLKNPVFKFKKEDFISFRKFIEENNYPVLSHSERYRKMYEPHYRFILMKKIGELM
ncbi:MAG: hypothetical protein KAH01_06155 [Caldisericia bacterium]|nr:hypothetical protein [Caldisericia bacterium]